MLACLCDLPVLHGFTEQSHLALCVAENSPICCDSAVFDIMTSIDYTDIIHSSTVLIEILAETREAEEGRTH